MQLSGSANGMWEDETTDRRGAPCWTSSATARAFLEAQLRQQHNMAQDLEGGTDQTPKPWPRLKHYTLAEDDLKHIRHRRRPHNRLGLALLQSSA